MLVGSGKVTFEVRLEGHKGNDWQVPYNTVNLSHGCDVLCVCVCVCVCV